MGPPAWLGVAVLGSIAAAVYRGQFTAAAPAGLPPRAARPASETLAGATGAAGRLPPDLGEAVVGVARDAFVAGMWLSAIIVAVATAAAAVLTVSVLRDVPHSGLAPPSGSARTVGAVSRTAADNSSRPAVPNAVRSGRGRCLFPGGLCSAA